ncbi:hypothetical protein DUNSADRAFT_8520 [Dunaliella salina]|uniref:Uncharacterized protein n=1 Tax=Dunaliella salina TaxID=3046 RepID=A0ABQ7GJA4_DUNSA|nr:hypothetical protein DUNSADRAFT_8520 [Dunaliella salina]|eukprot:KAF5834695.1 hypothetical protein DUNSADRAFT_8520 [Dunaliella salina]
MVQNSLLQLVTLCFADPGCAAGARVLGLASGVALVPSNTWDGPKLFAAAGDPSFCRSQVFTRRARVPGLAAGARVPGLAAGVALVPSGNAAVPTAVAAGDGLTSSLERLAVTVDKEGGLSPDGAAALFADGCTMPSLLVTLKPPADAASLARWLASPALMRALNLVSALLQHCEGRSEGIALQKAAVAVAAAAARVNPPACDAVVAVIECFHAAESGMAQ